MNDAAPGAAAAAAAAAATPAVGSRAQRLPSDPYPGIRPFLPFESTLLFGRARQVDEVLDRLRQSQFVAVLGGSGSGKSSLILAGVLPALRSFGIAEAGDFWLTLTTTPGSNVAAADSAARKHSPVTRLARRFAGLLQPLETPEANAARQAEIAEVFRQQGGFGRLLDRWSSQLAVRPGQNTGEARVLFVIDQFEEIFHPTNQGVEDARLLVERVLDHFLAPHARCFVVLTMRSEHLNDCAAYLELPDAINTSSFLVRRLDEAELREAITGPAQRYLRLRKREASRSGALEDAADEVAPRSGGLPPKVDFAAEVLERVLNDTMAITRDPDHLPLLQHLLARVWDAALAREDAARAATQPDAGEVVAHHASGRVPARITWFDLARAVHPSAEPGQAEAALAASSNVLRDCVENWPERLYAALPSAGRDLLLALVRQLAFKDPNTGMYSQQRLHIAAALPHLPPATAGAAPLDAAALKQWLTAAGFVRSVDYLFWDDEDPNRVTVKVSHESFIRGWPRFRRLIDEDAEHYDEYVDVLRRCAAWHASGRHDDQLLREDDLQRLGARGFDARHRDERQQAAWAALLKLDRDGVRLAAMQAHVGGFYAQSVQRLAAEAERKKQDKLKKRVMLVVVLGVLPLLGYSLLIQGPVTRRAELMFAAGIATNRTPLSNVQEGLDGGAQALDALLEAAEKLDLARTGNNSKPGRISQWLLDHLGWMPWVRWQEDFLRTIEEQTEPRVNGVLRELMVSTVWPGGGMPRPQGENYFVAPEARPETCASAANPDDPKARLPGRLFIADTRRDIPVRRALFVPERGTAEANAAAVAGGSTLDVRGASYDNNTQTCVWYDPPLVNVPLTLQPHVLVDSGLRYLAYSIDSKESQESAVTLLELEWARGEGGERRVVTTEPRNIVTGAQATERLRNAVGPSQMAVAAAWRSPGGRTAGLGDSSWRVITPTAQRLSAPEQEAAFVELPQASPGSPCARLMEAVDGAGTEGAGGAGGDGRDRAVFETGAHCVVVWRSEPMRDGSMLRQHAQVAAYEKPRERELEGLATNPPGAIAWLPHFGMVEAGPLKVLGGTGAEFDGWLAVRTRTGTGATRLLAMPWSTCALWRLGRQLQQDGKLEAPTAGRRQGVCEIPKSG